MANGTKVWKGNWNTRTLLFSLKVLNILHPVRREQVNIVMKRFKSILFQESEPANTQHGSFSSVAGAFASGDISIFDIHILNKMKTESQFLL